MCLSSPSHDGEKLPPPSKPREGLRERRCGQRRELPARRMNGVLSAGCTSAQAVSLLPALVMVCTGEEGMRAERYRQTRYKWIRPLDNCGLAEDGS